MGVDQGGGGGGGYILQIYEVGDGLYYNPSQYFKVECHFYTDKYNK